MKKYSNSLSRSPSTSLIAKNGDIENIRDRLDVVDTRFRNGVVGFLACLKGDGDLNLRGLGQRLNFNNVNNHSFFFITFFVL